VLVGFLIELIQFTKLLENFFFSVDLVLCWFSKLNQLNIESDDYYHHCKGKTVHDAAKVDWRGGKLKTERSCIYESI